jgi:hypothetical protein
VTSEGKTEVCPDSHSFELFEHPLICHQVAVKVLLIDPERAMAKIENVSGLSVLCQLRVVAALPSKPSA